MAAGPGSSLGPAREPGWYADPASPGHWRWWDGSSFTEHAVSADRPRRRATGTGGQTLELGPVDATAQLPTGPSADGGGPRGDARARAPRPPRTWSPGRTKDGRPHPPAVVARRWAVIVVGLALVVGVLALIFRGHPPALYWQGEPISNGSQVLAQAESAMRTTAAADEAAISSSSRCYFSLPNPSAHDVGREMACGPVLFPWSSRAKAWLEYPLSASPTGSGVRLSAQPPADDTLTVALPNGTVLRRPDGASPPKVDAGLAVPVVPYQRTGWAGLLSAPPQGLKAAPVDDVLGGWAHNYRVVAFGEVNHLASHLDLAALRQAVNPKGSAWSTDVSRVSRSGRAPLAKLLVPARGQVFAVAELAESPGEAAGPVPAGGAAGSSPQLQVVSGSTNAMLPVPNGTPSGLYVVAAVPIGSGPELVVSDKGLAQDVSLVNGQPGNVPGVLARLSPVQRLNLTGTLPGVSLHVSSASLVWFAGSDGGTVPPAANDAFLEVMMTATPLSASFLPASDFALRLAGGQVVNAQALPDADRTVIVMGFVVPAAFSTGAMVVAVGGRTFTVPVDFP